MPKGKAPYNKKAIRGDANFKNAKRMDNKTGKSSSKPYAPGGDVRATSEPARQSRLGKTQTRSGPKSRKTRKAKTKAKK